MCMDLKEKFDEIVEKIQKDPGLAASFQKDPVKTIEKITGMDLPDDIAENAVTTVKARLAAGGIGDLAGGFKKLF